MKLIASLFGDKERIRVLIEEAKPFVKKTFRESADPIAEQESELYDKRISTLSKIELLELYNLYVTFRDATLVEDKKLKYRSFFNYLQIQYGSNGWFQRELSKKGITIFGRLK